MMKQPLNPKSVLPWFLLLAMTGCGGSRKLQQAAYYGDHQTVQRLLATEDINKPWNVDTPLSGAAAGGKLSTVKLLLARGADPNGWLKKGSAYDFNLKPLLRAAQGGHEAVIRELLNAGADIDMAIEQAEQQAHPSIPTMTDALERLRALKAEEAPRLAAEKARRERKAELDLRISDIEAAEKAGDKAAGSGDAKEALARYTEALEHSPFGSQPDGRIRRKAIAVALSMSPRPSFPEEANRRMVRGQAFLEKASDANGYLKAASEIEKAAKIAPWWPRAYFNLGLVQEKVEDFQAAAASLKLYLLAAPEAPDAEAVQKKIYKLEVAQELAAPKQ